MNDLKGGFYATPADLWSESAWPTIARAEAPINKPEVIQVAPHTASSGPDRFVFNGPKASWYFDAIEKNIPPDEPPVGKKDDGGKPDYTLLPFKALEDTVKVLGFGAIKYGRNNWQNVEKQRYTAAAFRHLIAIAKGEEFDEESGLPHAAHLACCALFLGEIP